MSRSGTADGVVGSRSRVVALILLPFLLLHVPSQLRPTATRARAKLQLRPRRCQRQRRGAHQKQQQQHQRPRQLMRRSLTRAGARRLSSPSLVSLSAMRSYTATRRTSCPYHNNPRSPFHLQHHHLLLSQHPKQRKRKRKSIDMCLLGNRAKRGAVSCPSRIPSPTNTSGER